uniref:MAGUK p55 subfamily member 7 n=1 Tax=Rhabditophanes sp. KR3021 TaxID=114890 RepID=A0AC35TSA2_9BILA
MSSPPKSTHSVFNKAYFTHIDCLTKELPLNEQVKAKSIALIDQVRDKIDKGVLTIAESRHLLQSQHPTNFILNTCPNESNEFNELRQLLNKSYISSILTSATDILKDDINSLPDVPYEVDDSQGIAVKILKLIKHNEPLGATIKCKPDGRIVIARILAGGIADKCGVIQVGDSILEINDCCVSGMKTNDVASLLNTENDITLKLMPAQLGDKEDKNSHIFLRAMIGYNGKSDPNHPVPEAAIAFERGDILEILVNDDSMWYQAANLGNGSLASIVLNRKQDHDGFKIGLIPTNLCFTKLVNAQEIDRKHQRVYYENVVKYYPKSDSFRPILLIGPAGVGRNELKKRLILMNPEKYSAPIPHTSRAIRSHESNGVEYNFVSKRQMQSWISEGRFLEHGEYKGHYYGTLDLSLLALIKENRVPVLNPQPQSIKMLRNFSFKPIIIFIQPPDFEILKETRLRKQARALSGNSIPLSYGAGFTDSDLIGMLKSAAKIDQMYSQFFDAKIVNDDIDIAFKKLTDIINALDTQTSWIPKEWLTDY